MPRKRKIDQKKMCKPKRRRRKQRLDDAGFASKEPNREPSQKPYKEKTPEEERQWAAELARYFGRPDIKPSDYECGCTPNAETNVPICEKKLPDCRFRDEKHTELGVYFYHNCEGFEELCHAAGLPSDEASQMEWSKRTGLTCAVLWPGHAQYKGPAK